MSKRFRDQPQSPLQRAIYWIEYVMRHGTGEHLVSLARDMDAYQTGNLDILAVILSSMVGVYVTYLFLPNIYASLFGSKEKDVKGSKDKKDKKGKK